MTTAPKSLSAPTWRKGPEFQQRLFFYFAYLHQKFKLPVYTIAIRHVGTNVELTWSPCTAQLQCANEVTGPWVDVAGAASPFVIPAAAAMGHLRGVLRAVAWEAEDADPATVLARVDRLVQGLRVASLATMVYARAVRPVGNDAPWRVHVANAGHPPMLLRSPSML